MAAAQASLNHPPRIPNRWVQLVAGITAMIVISNYQYAFTLFTPGMRQTFAGTPYAKIAAVFSAFILFQTGPMPVAGYFVDKFGIRWIQTLGRAEFYLLYAMFFFACAGGLMATGNLSQIAKSLIVNNATVWGFAIVPLTVTLTPLCTVCLESCGVGSRTSWGANPRCF
jgi:MFS family permease